MSLSVQIFLRSNPRYSSVEPVIPRYYNRICCTICCTKSFSSLGSRINTGFIYPTTSLSEIWSTFFSNLFPPIRTHSPFVILNYSTTSNSCGLMRFLLPICCQFVVLYYFCCPMVDSWGVLKLYTIRGSFSKIHLIFLRDYQVIVLSFHH